MISNNRVAKGTKVARTNTDEELELLKKLPDALSEYLREHCPVDRSIVHIYKYFLDHGEEKTMVALLKQQFAEIEELYGPDHPFMNP